MQIHDMYPFDCALWRELNIVNKLVWPIRWTFIAPGEARAKGTTGL